MPTLRRYIFSALQELTEQFMRKRRLHEMELILFIAYSISLAATCYNGTSLDFKAISSWFPVIFLPILSCVTLGMFFCVQSLRILLLLLMVALGMVLRESNEIIHVMYLAQPPACDSPSINASSTFPPLFPVFLFWEFVSMTSLVQFCTISVPHLPY